MGTDLLSHLVAVAEQGMSQQGDRSYRLDQKRKDNPAMM